jgi:hypothetical protein
LDREASSYGEIILSCSRLAHLIAKEEGLDKAIIAIQNLRKIAAGIDCGQFISFGGQIVRSGRII